MNLASTCHEISIRWPSSRTMWIKEDPGKPLSYELHDMTFLARCGSRSYLFSMRSIESIIIDDVVI